MWIYQYLSWRLFLRLPNLLTFNNTQKRAISFVVRFLKLYWRNLENVCSLFKTAEIFIPFGTLEKKNHLNTRRTPPHTTFIGHNIEMDTIETFDAKVRWKCVEFCGYFSPHGENFKCFRAIEDSGKGRILWVAVFRLRKIHV